MSELLVLPLVGLGLFLLAVPVLVLVLLIVTLSLRGRVRTLEARLRALEQAGASAAGLGVPAAPVPAPEPPAPAPAPSFPAETAQPPPPLAPAPPLPPAAQPAGSESEVGGFEGRLGGTWMSRVGALILVLGIGFFLKHAFESEWIGPGGRVAIGLLAGVGFLLVGERLQRAAYRLPAQGLVAAGVATLYLSVYAAHALYELVGMSRAFLSMALVTAAGMTIALRHHARPIAILASLGGFLTPVVLSPATDAAVPLFGYLAILDTGILAAAGRRRWTELSLLGLAATQLLYWGWMESWYRPERLLVALGAATVFFVLFALAGLVTGREEGGVALRGSVRGIVILGAPTAYFLAAREILSPEHPRGLALLCLMLAAVYALAGRWARSAAPARAVLSFALAIAFLTLAFTAELSEHGLAIAWSVEGAALLWGGFRLGLPRLRAGAFVVLVLAWSRWWMLVTVDSGHAGRFLLDHPAFWPTVALVVTAWLGAGLYRPRDPASTGRARWEGLAYPVLVLVALGSPALLLSVELNQFPWLRLPPAYAGVLTTTVWVVTAMPLLALARGDRSPILLGAVTLVLAGAGLRAATEDAGAWGALPSILRPPVLNPRFLAGVLIVVLYGLYARVVPEFPHVPEKRRARLGALAAGATALFLLWNLSVEVRFLPLQSLPPGEAAKVQNMGLSVLWTLCAFVAMGLGMWRRRASLRIGAIGLFGLTVAKVLVVDLSTLDAVYRILSFLVLGAVLMLASFLYARHRRRSSPAPLG